MKWGETRNQHLSYIKKRQNQHLFCCFLVCSCVIWVASSSFCFPPLSAQFVALTGTALPLMRTFIWPRTWSLERKKVWLHKISTDQIGTKQKHAEVRAGTAKQRCFSFLSVKKVRSKGTRPPTLLPHSGKRSNNKDNKLWLTDLCNVRTPGQSVVLTKAPLRYFHVSLRQDSFAAAGGQNREEGAHHGHVTGHQAADGHLLTQPQPNCRFQELPQSLRQDRVSVTTPNARALQSWKYIYIFPFIELVDS